MPHQPRRTFLRTMTLAAASATIPAFGRQGSHEGKIMTVLGPIAPDRLGMTLSHEHCVVDFLGAEKAVALRHNRDQAIAEVLPRLQRVKELGCQSLAECTPNYIGRDPLLLKHLATQTGLNILTNTGYYGAAGNKFLPRHAFTETADQLSARWLKEWQDGIDGTGIRPGFIKLGVEKGLLSDLHTKLLRAAARVHVQSGLVIAVHTGDGAAALDELRVLGEEHVSARALIWVHAQNDPTAHVEVATRGAWVSLDGYGASEKSQARYITLLQALKAKNLLHRVLLSHDHFWSVEGNGERGTLKLANGGPEPFTPIFTLLIPALRKADFSPDEIKLLLVTNPANAFTLRKHT